jgi:Effector protein
VDFQSRVANCNRLKGSTIMKRYTNGGASILIDGEDIDADDSPESVSAEKRYEREVAGALDTIQCSRVGRLLVQSLTRELIIVPYSSGGRNAKATPDRPGAAGGRGAYQYSGGALRLKNGQPIRYRDGGGSDSTIEFTPSMFQTSGVPQAVRQMITSGSRRDEILFHEMTHATHHMAGKLNRSDAPPGFDTKEEFWAVMMTNIYSSGWNRPLRKNHRGHQFISLQDATTLYAQFNSMIDWMCRDMPALTRGIADLDWIPFNPLRDSYARRSALRVTSQQAVFR